MQLRGLSSLVMGASGFVGGRLAERLAKEEWVRVRGMVCDPEFELRNGKCRMRNQRRLKAECSKSKDRGSKFKRKEAFRQGLRVENS